MRNSLRSFFATLVLCFALSAAYAQDYYVSALTGSNANDGLTPQTAVATIQRGADLVQAGGTVFIMNGRYVRTTFGSVLEFRKSGTPQAYITFKPYPGHNPVISAYGGSWNAIVLDGSYVILDGLELEGNNANLRLADAEASYLASRATPAVFNAAYNTNAISIGATGAVIPHHIIVRNCRVHDFPGGGIGVGKADYVTVDRNVVYNNSWYTMYATSGISLLGSTPIDTYTGHKMFVTNNIVYNNYTQVKWRRSNPALDAYSDGNGIILDANNGTQGTAVYTGRTLVQNNVSYNNGGGGVHAYEAARIDIINNTAYNNGTKVGYPEIDAQNSTDVRISNNIMYARTGGNCNGNDGGVYDYNLYYNGPVLKQGPNDLVAEPKFVRLGLDGAADFRLQAGSPAINTGTGAAGFFSPTDLNGLARPQGSKPERGAYEFQAGTQAQTITFAPLPALAIGAADYAPQAAASSGLPLTLRSSNPAVAVIVNGKIQLINGGTATITASQGGDASYAEAPEVSQPLTVASNGFGPLPMNSTFDTNTAGWTTTARAPATIALSSVPRTGFSGQALSAAVANGGSTTIGAFDVQLRHPAPLVAGRTYTIRFRASSTTNVTTNTLDLVLQSDRSPFTSYRSFFAIRLTPTPTDFTYTYTATTTDATTLIKFMLGRFTAPVYIDDVTVTSVPAPNAVIKQGPTTIAATTGRYDFGPVAFGTPVKALFTVENIGARTLTFLYDQRVRVTGTGFALATNLPAPTIDAGGNATFEVQFQPTGTGAVTGSVSIASNDPARATYTFALAGTGVKADQTLAWPEPPALTYGDPAPSLTATASSGLPVAYAVISGPGALGPDGTLMYTGAGDIVVEATQPGGANYNAAPALRRTFRVNPKELLVTAEDQTVTYGDPAPAYTYVITGFVPGEGAAQLTGSPELSSPYTPATPATETPVISLALGTLSADNYFFTPVNGQVSIRHTFPQLLEAETAVVRGGKIEGNFAGFTGTGYVAKINKPTNSVEWTANISGAGVSTLTFRYASPVRTQDLTLTVNGVVLPSGVTFATTGSWGAWATVSVPATLRAGLNTIRLNGSGTAAPSLDHLLITNDTFAPAPAARNVVQARLVHNGSSSEKSSADLSINAYPVPATTKLTVQVPARDGEQVTVRLVNLYGRTLYAKTTSGVQGATTFDFDVQAVPAGNYVLKVQTARASKTQLVVVEK